MNWNIYFINDRTETQTYKIPSCQLYCQKQTRDDFKFELLIKMTKMYNVLIIINKYKLCTYKWQHLKLKWLNVWDWFSFSSYRETPCTPDFLSALDICLHYLLVSKKGDSISLWRKWASTNHIHHLNSTTFNEKPAFAFQFYQRFEREALETLVVFQLLHVTKAISTVGALQCHLLAVVYELVSL